MDIEEQVAATRKALAEEEAEAASQPLDQSFEEVFAKWFQRFNDEEPEAKTLPHPGFISLKKAVEQIQYSALAVSWPKEALQYIERVQCVTRHMHAHPTELPRFWASSSELFVVDVATFRVRRSSDVDQPPNWFAVQVNHEELNAVMYAALDAKTEAEQDMLPGTIAEARAQQRARARQQPGDFADRVAPFLGNNPDLVAAVRRAEQLGYESVEHQPPSPGPMPDRPRIPADADVEAFQHAMPPDYELRITPRGFVAVWRSQPQVAAAQAVRDAWSHHVSAEILRRR